MPILKAEPDIYPDNLLESPVAENWWVVYTRSRREKQLVRQLRADRIAHYCPMVTKRGRGPRGRPTESFLPLFSNYVFLNGTPEERVTALKSNMISNTIEVVRTAELIFDLNQIRGLILSGEPVTPEAKLEPGDRVRVKAGPFKSYVGTIIQRHGKSHLLVDVRFMNQGASVEIDEADVEPA